MSQIELNRMVVEFIESSLSPTEDERKQISLRYEDLSNMLKGVNFQSGSYARFTAITPVNDLDVIWEIDHEALKAIPNFVKLQKSIDPVDLDVSNLLHDLANRLTKEYRNIGQAPRIKARTHSVGIFFGETDDDFSIDVVPAVPSGDINERGDDIYLVPEIIRLSKIRRAQRYLYDSKSIKWLRSDPKGYIEDAKDLNDANEYFRKTAKFVKSWRYSSKKRDEKFSLKSFHLELVVSDLFKTNTNLGCLEGICSFFDQIGEFLEKPRFPDKANSSIFTDGYINDISDGEWLVTNNAINHAKKIIDQIKIATAHDEIKKLLKDLAAAKINIEKTTTINFSRTQIIDAYSKPYSDQ